MYSSFWWGQANQASALGSQSIAGNGVYYSIDPQYRYVWPASVYSTPEGLSKILDFFYDVNPTAKDTPPIFYQGYSANQATNKTLDAANSRQVFEAPYKSAEDGQGYWFNEPVYDGYRNFAGYKVQFKHIQAFDSAVSSGDLDPKSSNRGLRSWATIGLDMGRMQNINPDTSEYEAEGDQLGSFKVNTYCGKNLISGQDLFYQDIIIRGATNDLGESLLNGEVGALGMDETLRRTQMYTFGVEVTPGAGISIEIAA
jgi:hypothetical protein